MWEIMRETRAGTCPFLLLSLTLHVNTSFSEPWLWNSCFTLFHASASVRRNFNWSFVQFSMFCLQISKKLSLKWVTNLLLPHAMDNGQGIVGNIWSLISADHDLGHSHSYYWGRTAGELGHRSEIFTRAQPHICSPGKRGNNSVPKEWEKLQEVQLVCINKYKQIVHDEDETLILFCAFTVDKIYKSAGSIQYWRLNRFSFQIPGLKQTVCFWCCTRSCRVAGIY